MKAAFAITAIVALSAVSGHAQVTPTPVAATSIAVEPARLALGKEIIDVVMPPSQREQMMGSILNSMMQSMVAGMSRSLGLEKEFAVRPAAKAVFDRFVDRQRELGLADIKAALPGLVDAYAHAYARNFSLDELRAVRSFVVTPAGAAFVQRAPALLADPDVAAWQRKLAEQSAARQQVEIKKLVEKMKAISPSEKQDVG